MFGNKTGLGILFAAMLAAVVAPAAARAAAQSSATSTVGLNRTSGCRPHQTACGPCFGASRLLGPGWARGTCVMQRSQTTIPKEAHRCVQSS